MSRGFILVFILFFSLFSFFETYPNIIVLNDSHRKIDVNNVVSTITYVIDRYTNVTGIILSKPIVVRIKDRVYIGRYVTAYTEERDKYYQIITSSISLHVLAHELFHIYQYERWHRFLDSMAEKYNWFIESMTDAVPIYLFNTSPIIHNSLDTYLGFRESHWFKSSKRDYVLRIFWLKLFEKYGFKNILERYFNVYRDDLNPLQQMFNFTELTDVLSYFYYSCDMVDKRSIYYYVPRPYLYSFGAVCIESDKNISIYVNASPRIYYVRNIISNISISICFLENMNNYDGSIMIYIDMDRNMSKIYLINILNVTVFWYLRA